MTAVARDAPPIRLLAAAAASNILAVLPAFLVGSLAVLISQDLGFGPQRLGAAVSLYYAIAAGASLLAGPISERLGAHRSLRLAAIGSGLSCLLVATLAQSWLHLVLALSLAAFSNAVIQPAANLALSRGIAPERLGFAFGLKQSAGPAAILVAGAAVPAVGLTIGWRWAFGLTILLAMTTYVLALGGGGPQQRTTKAERRVGDLRQSTLVLLATAVALAVASASTLGAFFVASAVELGHGVGAAGVWLSVGGLSSVGMRILQGWLADRRTSGHLVMVVTLVLLGAVGCVLLSFAASPWVLMLATLLAFGCGWGWPGLYQFAIVRLNPGAPGDATGTIMVGMFAGGMVGPVLFGTIAERSSYAAAWLVQATLLLTGAILILLSRRRLRREVGERALHTARAAHPSQSILPTGRQAVRASDLATDPDIQTRKTMNSSVTVLDPRMPAPASDITLAPRTREPSGFVLLLDNGKLGDDYGPYRAVFDAIEAEVQRRLDIEVRRKSDDLLVGGVDRLESLAEEIRSSGAAGVVIALCDWGVSQPSTILASELEARGVPVCVITMQVGFLVTLATAVLLAPGLPIVKLASLRDATYEQMREEAARIAPEVIDGLTLEGEELHHRFQAHGPQLPPVATESGELQVDAEDAATAFTNTMADCGLGDGLPLIAPTAERTRDMLAAMGAETDEQIWPAVAPRRVPVLAREIAVLAVMAGVPLASAPVVIAAYRAMAAPEFRLFQSAITTHPGGTLVLVSGPRTEELGIASGRGCLGPGFRGNASVGRAVSLGYSFLLGALPGGGDLTAQGAPAEFTYCCAENLAESPWAGIHAEEGHDEDTTVTVVKCEGPHNILDQMSTAPERLLDTFGATIATLGGNTAYVPGCQTVVFMNPEHAALLAGAGWSKADVKAYLFDIARNRRADLAGRGLAPIWPAWFHSVTDVPVVLHPEDFMIAVTGGAGPASQVAIPWGYSRAVTTVIGSR